MRVLVTGADGFVGRHLVEEFRSHGHSAIASDIKDTDLATPWRAQALLDRKDPEYVVHLAARYGRILCRDEPHRSVSDNAASTTELAMLCAKREIPILYTSTSEVYGDHGENPLSEGSRLRMPTTIYGLSKRWGEEALQLYMPADKLCIVRPNMLYGPGQKAGYGCCALATFIQSARRGEALYVHRDASRSWLYIGDAVRALRLLVEGGHTGIFNMGNSTERTSMLTLAQKVREISGSRSQIIELDAPEGQIRHKVYDSSKLSYTLAWADWQPTVKLQQGIEATLSC